jgi:putative transposase
MNIRRYYVPNAIIFITQVVDRRIPIFTCSAYIDLLIANLRETEKHHPYDLVGHVFRPEHFHIMLHPTGDSNFSKVMQSVKPNVTKDYKALNGVSGKMKFWQKGFWDHVIRDEVDFERHLDYIHYNPVRYESAAKSLVHVGLNGSGIMSC